MYTLLMIDLQNDFCLGGALEVPSSEEIIPKINHFQQYFHSIVATRDWHPSNHISFASTHNKEINSEIQTSYGTQVLWSDHCIGGKKGAELHPKLNTSKINMIINKGLREDRDSYSAFYDNGQNQGKGKGTGLTAYLNYHGTTEVILVGLAFDYCVYYSALDALAEGFKVSVITDLTRAVDNLLDSSLKAKEDMLSKGIELIDSDAFIQRMGK